MEISAGARWPACLELPQPLSSSSFGPTAGCSCSCTAGHRASLATGRRASLAAGRRALAPSRCFGPLVVREKQKKQTNKKRGRRKKIRRRENGKLLMVRCRSNVWEISSWLKKEYFCRIHLLIPSFRQFLLRTDNFHGNHRKHWGREDFSYFLQCWVKYHQCQYRIPQWSFVDQWLMFLRFYGLSVLLWDLEENKVKMGF
ncbi:uncharacterized protein LOC107303450 isoform X1 [Oryza brachyantha]|uniref:uncharacterized protein LOC107303450 isoform X1 n=1 Tax=Oryza brachyantha TaxID=4533 RepID=UPI001ADB6226|nr:uncharacterized protein LOC107303450 isoform X1 [Oryza brachyantha]